MRCEPIGEVIGGRASARELMCAGCGCTERNACAGGCHWVSLEPPVCSGCMNDADDGEREGSFFGDEQCPASPTPALHAPIWIDEATGYCARCRGGFTT